MKYVLKVLRMLRIELCHPCSVSRLFCVVQPILFYFFHSSTAKTKSFYVNKNIKAVWPHALFYLAMYFGPDRPV
jgi:hypothetical protein